MLKMNWDENSSEFSLTQQLIERAVSMGFIGFKGNMTRALYRHIFDSLILSNHSRIGELEARIAALEARDEDHDFGVIDPPE